MDSSFLGQILGKVRPNRFWNEYWEKEPLILPGILERFDPIPSISALGGIDILLREYRSPVMLLGTLAIRETEGLSDRVAILPERARELYNEGATLEFDCLEMYVPELRIIVERLSKDLRLPAGAFGKAVGYLSSAGSGVSPHFDAYVNFVFQLRGRKTWSLLKNSSAEYPMEHYALSELPFIPEELKSYWRGNPPVDYSNAAKDFEIEPGTLLFLPRGTWHATNATEESFSVHFTFSIPTWLDVVLASLRLNLASYPELRILAMDKWSDKNELVKKIEPILAKMEVNRLFELRDEPYDKYQIASAVFRQVLEIDN